MSDRLTSNPGDACGYPAIAPPLAVPMATPPPRDCPYLPGRQATMRAFYASKMPPKVYHDFMDAGFRRAGCVVYQPICVGCRACQPIRVPVAEFAPSKSLRRCRRRNGDLLVTIAKPQLTEEKYELYRRYQALRHNGDMEENAQSLDGFLYQSPVSTVEFVYRDNPARLVAVGICDVCERSVSSVYFFFDPAESQRGLGNFGALTEIDYAASLKIPYWYVGYWGKGG